MNFTPQFHIPEAKASKAGMNRLASVTEFMTPLSNLVTFSPDQTIGETIEMMLRHKISGAPVLNEDRQLVGMISEKDCLHLLIDNTYYNYLYRACKVKDYMSHDITTVSSDASIIDVANLFISTNFRRFPVVTQHRLVGQISRRDVLKAARAIRSTTW